MTSTNATPASQTQPARSPHDAGSLSLRGSYEPLVPTGVLDQYEQVDLTPVIGREFRDVQLPTLIDAPNSDDLLRELAIIVSQRNVVFFRNQDGKLSDAHLKKLANKLGELSGRPQASGLHIHPTENTPDLELSPITTAFIKRKPGQSLLASRGWHSDITFEPVPSDFAILNIHTLPPNGGDTLWASAYEAYDRLTPAMAKFLEGLTAVHDGNGFHTRAKVLGTEVYAEKRGHPANVGADLRTIHPVIRTNAITGWKGLFVNPGFTKRIVELSLDESEVLLNYLFRLIFENHDLQVRYAWQKDDVAIWSNASSFHNVTVDYEGDGVRKGNRVVSLGERPYFSPASRSRREALGLQRWTE
ncbi:hypothetical protein RQP46_009494 [Phenoliferia psychrophenolica]